MTRRRRFLATLATSALALAMFAATASAQQPLPPLPKPDTPPPVPPILQSYKPVTADRLKSARPPAGRLSASASTLPSDRAG